MLRIHTSLNVDKILQKVLVRPPSLIIDLKLVSVHHLIDRNRACFAFHLIDELLQGSLIYNL